MVDTLELHGVDRVPPEPGVEPQGYGQPQIGGEPTQPLVTERLFLLLLLFLTSPPKQKKKTNKPIDDKTPIHDYHIIASPQVHNIHGDSQKYGALNAAEESQATKRMVITYHAQEDIHQPRGRVLRIADSTPIMRAFFSKLSVALFTRSKEG